jgi:hypothetical protein
MRKIVVYSESMQPKLLEDAVSDLELKMVSGRRELVAAIVGERDLHAVIIQKDSLDDPYRKFLGSLKANFPFLYVGIVAPADMSGNLEGHHLIDLETADTTAEIRRFLEGKTFGNRREHHRFDWPLKGYVSYDKESWQEYRLRSISSGGAFLECGASLPVPGTRAYLRIVFQNFSLSTSCEVLDARQASSNLPLGFGVRFLDLSEAAVQKIDQIVDDALMHVLLDPGFQPAVPSLGEEEATREGFDLI